MNRQKYLIITAALVVILAALICGIFLRLAHQSEPAAVPVVLSSALAGTWYPADAEILNRQIAAFFSEADVKPISNVIALVLPHAGYQFSGRTAATALKTIDRKYKRIVVIGPSHRVPMEEMLGVPRVTHYQTPLGQIPLDVEFINKLLEYPVFQNVPQAHNYEHSVQIELPLLQHCQQDFKLVPIVAGDCSYQTIQKAAVVLRSLIDQQTLVVASSDFVHYGPNYGYVPFTEDVAEQIKRLDMGAYEYIAAADSKGFLDYRHNTGATICGYIPIAILLSMLEHPAETALIKYTTSGEVTGDYANSVSYLSVVFTGNWQDCPVVKPAINNFGLTPEEKEQLLVLARESITYFLDYRKAPNPSDLNIAISEGLKVPRAAFVTLKKDSQLRGCIGDIFPRQSLYKSVITNAINAAVNDRRFFPVTKAECSDIKIEISVLTPPAPVDSSDRIRIGTDGVVLSKNGHSAVFLPQVAPQQGWDVNQMLTRLSLKAGLPQDAWKEGAKFLVFEADVFGEKE